MIHIDNTGVFIIIPFLYPSGTGEYGIMAHFAQGAGVLCIILGMFIAFVNKTIGGSGTEGKKFGEFVPFQRN